MHKVFGLVLLLLLVASACSSDSSDATSPAFDAGQAADATPGEPAGSHDASVPDDEAQREAQQTDAGAEAPSSPTPSAGSTPQATCGFGAGHTPELVEIEQIPGEGRQGNPSALQNPLNGDFPEPLVPIDRILSGGPPPDGIPPIDRPVFQTASSVDWLRCNEPVLSLSINGEARAYPVQVMTWHELVNDTFGDLPVTVSYCPLCNSALAYERDLGDRVVTFGTSGKLFNSSLVMYDRETESMWTHFDGQAVVGTLTGTELELLPMQTTSWSSFLDAHPAGLVLTRDTGFARNYGTNPYLGYDDVTQNPFLYDGEYDERLAAKQRVVAIRSGDDSVAVVLDSLADAGVIVTDVAGTSLTVWHLPGTATALEQNAIADGRDVGATGVFVPEVDGQSLTFTRNGDADFVDDETGSRWNILGRAIGGRLEGAQLQPVEHLDTFWFALAAFEPETRIVTG